MDRRKHAFVIPIVYYNLKSSAESANHSPSQEGLRLIASVILCWKGNEPLPTHIFTLRKPRPEGRSLKPLDEEIAI